MFIKLTNVAKEHKDKPLIINPRYIVSVFPGKDEEDQPVTILYGALKEAWSVKETMDEVFEMIKDYKDQP